MASFPSFVNPSDDEASKLVGEMGGSDLQQLEQLGMDGESLFKSWVNGFAYEIGDVKVDGDTAKATTKITSKQLYVVLTSWGDSFADDAMNQDFSTTDEIYAYAGKTFMAALDAATPVETEVTFTLTKDGKDWKLDMDNTDNQQAVAVFPLPRLSVTKGFVADSFRARNICRKQGAVGPQERCYGSFSYDAVLSLRTLQKR